MVKRIISSLIKESQQPADEQRRDFLKQSACALGGLGALCALTPFVSSWMPSAKALAAGASIRVDISHLQPGQQMIVEWRGKPVWIIRRTADMLAQLAKYNAQLRDPDSHVPQQPLYAQNCFRSIKPEYLVLIGLCTHLGCSPQYNHADAMADGFYCPCHGSVFDLSGRVYQSMPAPINMQVPPYRFVNEQVIMIGEDQHG